MSSVQAQLDVYNFCQKLKKFDELLYMPGTVTCWIDDFKDYIEPQLGFPVNSGGNEEDQRWYFTNAMHSFANHSAKGKEHKAQTNIGFIDWKLVFMKFSIKSAGGLYDPYFLKNPIREKWED